MDNLADYYLNGGSLSANSYKEMLHSLGVWDKDRNIDYWNGLNIEDIFSVLFLMIERIKTLEKDIKKLNKQLDDREEEMARRDRESLRCCEGGPQWGHEWGCPKCPD